MNEWSHVLFGDESRLSCDCLDDGTDIVGMIFVVMNDVLAGMFMVWGAIDGVLNADSYMQVLHNHLSPLVTSSIGECISCQHGNVS